MAQPTTLNALAVARRIAARLTEDGLPYGIGGALALGAWGAPRATKDVDLSVFVREDGLERLFDALERAGLMIERAVARRDVERIGMFKARAGRMFVDVFIAGHPQYDDMERRCVPIDDGEGGLLSDVIDLERLLAQRPDMDLAYVRGWLVKMVPAEDPRLDVLDDLERRFARRP